MDLAVQHPRVRRPPRRAAVHVAPPHGRRELVHAALELEAGKARA